MKRRKSSIPQVRGTLYRIAQALGDFEALGRGPEATARRLVRRTLGKATGRILRNLFR